jgi:putative ABC transport system permease protein
VTVRPSDLPAAVAEALRGNPLRSLLTLLGVAIGVAAVILLTAIGTGAKNYVEAQFAGFGSNILEVTPGKTETRGGMPIMGPTRHKLTLSDSNALEREGRLFTGVAPVVFGTTEVKFGGRTRSVPVLGVTPAFSRVRNLHVEIGAFVTDADSESRRHVAVLGKKVKQELFGGANALGQLVRLGEARYRVVGVMRHKGVSLAVDLDDLVFVPARSAQELFDLDTIFEIHLQVRNRTDIDAAKEQARAILFREHNRHEDFTITDQTAILSSLFSILDILTLVLGGIAAISLLVGGVGIMNIMLVTVKERTREIGIRMAVGARRRDLLVQFLLESTALSLLGGVAGIAAGLGGTALIRLAVPKFPAEVPGWSVALAFTFSLLVGIFFGVYPAQKAASQNPIEALRYE